MCILVGGFKDFLFSPLPGEMIQFDTYTFQMGWSNHQRLQVINPDSTYAIAWQLLTSCCMAFVAIVTPIQVRWLPPVFTGYKNVKQVSLKENSRC